MKRALPDRPREWWLRASLGGMTASVLLAMVCLWKVTALDSLALFFLGAPVFGASLGVYLVLVYLDLKDHGVFQPGGKP